MKIVIDNKIPFLEGVFEPYAEVIYLDGAAISAATVRDATVLVIRTRTRCNQDLIDSSAVQMIATATIGSDHIDLDYCRLSGIEVSTSSGCNAHGVAQWVFAALIALGVTQTMRIGIVGVGNVGKIVSSVASGAGFEVLECDPPRAISEGLSHFITFEELINQSDIVTFHVPLTTQTKGMVSDFSGFRPAAIILNSSRGEVIESDSLISALDSGRLKAAALDVWPGEPNIDPKLLDRCAIATPHIAGYSLEGKAMGSAMAVRAVASRFGIENLVDWYPPGIGRSPSGSYPTWSEIREQMQQHYRIMDDDLQLRTAPQNFEALRNNYSYRKEFF